MPKCKGLCSVDSTTHFQSINCLSDVLKCLSPVLRNWPYTKNTYRRSCPCVCTTSCAADYLLRILIGVLRVSVRNWHRLAPEGRRQRRVLFARVRANGLCDSVSLDSPAASLQAWCGALRQWRACRFRWTVWSRCAHTKIFHGSISLFLSNANDSDRFFYFRSEPIETQGVLLIDKIKIKNNLIVRYLASRIIFVCILKSWYRLVCSLQMTYLNTAFFNFCPNNEKFPLGFDSKQT